VLNNLTPQLKKRILYAHTGIFLMLSTGTVGIHLIEGFPWFESFYFVAATVTTVGYGDIIPATPAGRMFTVALMLFGVGTVLYALTILAQSLIQSEVFQALGIRRRNREMEKLSNHFIICGAGRVGRRVIKSLRSDNLPYVVIEINPDKIALLEDATYVVEGDATLDANLKRAGVERAAGLATCLTDDAKNVYVVLTARHMNPSLHIVARADEEQAEPKLIRAGANRVVSPTIIGSLGMARSLTRPAIADFMDSIVAENLDLIFEEIPIARDSKYVGKALKDTNISHELNLLIVAIRRSAGEMIFNPSGLTEILGDDLLIVIGKAEGLKSFLHK
jgi:voltage-gated potassium channel